MRSLIFCFAAVAATFLFTPDASAQCATGTCAVPQAAYNTVSRSAVLVQRAATFPVRVVRGASCQQYTSSCSAYTPRYQRQYTPRYRVFGFWGFRSCR